MKIIYSIRRNRLNWGARSTGKALYQLLIEKHKIVEDFDGISFPIPKNLNKDLELIKVTRLESYLNRILRKLRIEKKQTPAEELILNNVDDTALNLIKYQDLNPLLKKTIEGIKKSDALVINGEGSMIFSDPPRKELYFFFALMKIAKEHGKKTFYINAMASDCPVSGFNQLFYNEIEKSFQYCDQFIARDPTSYQFLKDKNVPFKLNYIPDQLFSWIKYIDEGLTAPKVGDSILPFPDQDEDYGKFNFNNPYICIAGSSYLYKKGNANLLIERYVILIEHLKKLGLQIYLVETCATDAFLFEVSKKSGIEIIPSRISILTGISILANAKLFITGRYHPAIMASLGGTPCILMDSNSHKTHSLQIMLEYEAIKVYSPELSDIDIREIFSDSKKILLEGQELRDKIKNTARKRADESRKINDYIY